MSRDIEMTQRRDPMVMSASLLAIRDTPSKVVSPNEYFPSFPCPPTTR